MNEHGRISKIGTTALLSGCAIAALLFGVSANLPSSVAAPITIELRDGRSFTGEVDRETKADGPPSEQRLFLRFESPGITLTRPFDWDDIASAKLGEKTLSATELKGMAGTLISTASPRRYVARNLQLPAALPAEGLTEAIRTPALPIVRSILVDAKIANWNGTVEMDGLLVTVWLLDESGNSIRAAGSVEVELIAPRSRTFNSAPHHRGHVFDRIGRWGEMFSATGRDEAYRFRLAFQADHPEFDLTLGRYGLVNVKVTVPGCGVFEQSADLVRIRPFSPLRDLNERTTGERFFSIERTSRGDR